MGLGWHMSDANFEGDDIDHLTQELEEDLFRMTALLAEDSERLGGNKVSEASDEVARSNVAQLYAIWSDAVAKFPNPRARLYDEVAVRRIPASHPLHPTPDMPLAQLLLLVSWCRDEGATLRVPDNRPEPTAAEGDAAP